MTINASFVGTETTFSDKSGAVTRIHDHIVEQDVSLFLSAGRLDFAAHPGSDFRIVPMSDAQEMWQRSVRHLHP